MKIWEHLDLPTRAPQVHSALRPLCKVGSARSCIFFCSPVSRLSTSIWVSVGLGPTRQIPTVLFPDNQNSPQPKIARWPSRVSEETDASYKLSARVRVQNQSEITVSKQQSDKPRKATVGVQYARVCLRPPYRRPLAKGVKLFPLNVTATLVREKNSPLNEKHIEWMLLTDSMIWDFNDAQEKIQWYAKRWQIECYHKTIKSGFHVETCRPHTVHRLYRFIAMVSVLTVKIYLWFE